MVLWGEEPPEGTNSVAVADSRGDGERRVTEAADAAGSEAATVGCCDVDMAVEDVVAAWRLASAIAAMRALRASVASFENG